MIPAIFVIYGTTLLLNLHQGGDHQALSWLDRDDITQRIQQFIATALLILSLGDTAMRLVITTGRSTS
ncbi:MAG: hypothetical protein P8M25_03395 [Paracoccaceae bacterium]|nr:hypothetical protein [Paracoccaceae bacterium]